MVTKIPLKDIVIPSWSWHLPDANMEHKLFTSLSKFGQLRPLVVNKAKELIDGRSVLDAMLRLKWEEALCLVIEADPIEVALALELRHDVDYVTLATHVAQKSDSIVSIAPFSSVNLQHYRTLTSNFDWSQYEENVQGGLLADEDDAFVMPEKFDEETVHVTVQTTTKTTVTVGQRRPSTPILPDVSGLAAPVVPDVVLSGDLDDAWAMNESTAGAPKASTIPTAPEGGVHFYGPDTKRREEWRPSEPPVLDRVDELELDVETDGLKWYGGNRPIGIAIRLPDGKTQYLPFGHTGGNLDEATVKRWAQRELRGKKINNQYIAFDIHMMHAWGVDLEEQGCTFSDPSHWAALLDEYRKDFKLDTLGKDYLKRGKTGQDLDKNRMNSYHAADVEEYARNDVALVRELKEIMWPMLDAEDLQRVRQLEDDVIPAVCEMERNAAYIDRPKLQQWVTDSESLLHEYMYKVTQPLGYQISPDSNEDWRKLFAHHGIEVKNFTENGTPSFTDAYLATIDVPDIQTARTAGKLMSLRSKFLTAYNQVVGEDNKLRFSLHQLKGDQYGTIRGRFSMSNKNLQQVFSVDKQREAFGFDAEDGSHDDEIFLVRKLFIPESGLFLCADAQSIEYRLAAHFSNSEKLIAAYKEDPWTDFHKTVMGFIAPFKKVTRRTVKGLNFGKIYGAGRDTVAHTLGLDRSESDQIVEIYDKTLPEMKALHQLATKTARDRGFVRTIMGRRARFKTDEQKQWAHAALNYIIQGSAADIMKKKIVELHRERKYTRLLMRMTVHDEVSGDAQQPETEKRVREILNEQTMLGLLVPIMWNVGIGKNWADAK